MKRLPVLFVLLLALGACKPYADVFLYRVVTMGFAGPGDTLNADDGKTYTFPEGTGWEEGKRILAIFNVTRETGEKTAEAILVDSTAPLYKEPRDISVKPLPDSIGTKSDILLRDGWYSGGCLNLRSRFKSVEGKGHHYVNLLTSGVPGDTLYLELTHHTPYQAAEDEVPVNHDFYASFPMEGLLAGRDTAYVTLSWTWEGETSTRTEKIFLLSL